MSAERQFTITPKTPYTFFDEPGQALTFTLSLDRIVNDTIVNAQELSPSVDFEDLASLIKWRYDNKYWISGRIAMRYALAGSIGKTARVMEWDMHDPHVVYMSCAQFIINLGSYIDNQVERAQMLRDGKLFPPSGVSKADYLGERKAEVLKYGTPRKIIQDNLNLYTGQYVPDVQVPGYTQVLDRVLRLGHGKGAPKRDAALKLLKRGDIAGAQRKLDSWQK